MSYPVALHLAGRRCVVVGGGTVATRKVRALLAADALVVVVSPEASDDLAKLAADAVIELELRPFAPADLDGAWLVVSATDNPEVARAVAAAAEARAVFCNAAELPAVSSFTSAKVVRQGDITVGISTAGQSPAFTSWLAERIGADLGPEYAQVCELLAELRASLQSEGLPTDTVDWRKALDGGIVDLVRDGQMDQARELLQTCR